MDKMSLRLTETMTVGDAFEASDRDLGIQLDRLGEDDERWALVAHLADRFVALAARQDGLKVMVERSFQRDFAIDELRQITVETRTLTAEIKRVMDELEGSPAPN